MVGYVYLANIRKIKFTKLVEKKRDLTLISPRYFEIFRFLPLSSFFLYLLHFGTY